MYMSIDLSIYLSTYLPIYPSIHPSIHLPTCKLENKAILRDLLNF